MKTLVDTHALIWYITNDKKLPSRSKLIIEDPSSSCFVSIASLWEMGIKNSLGKLELKAGLERIFEIIEDSGFTLLPITPDHILVNAGLEYNHRDPFDRLIIAQAQFEDLSVITKDPEFQSYNISLVWKE